MKLSSNQKLGGMDKTVFLRVKNATKLSDNEIVERHEEFIKQFPSGGISVAAFKNLSQSVLEAGEVDEFTDNVFRMFDVDKNGFLTFEEFTLAIEVHATNGNPLEKLSWLFDHVYDKNKSGHISRDELESILITLLKMENFNPAQAKELVNDIFNDLDLNRDGLINRREFLVATSQSELLLSILSSAAEREQVRKTSEPQINPSHATAAIAAASVVKDAEQKRGSVRSKRKKHSKEAGDRPISFKNRNRSASRRRSMDPSFVYKL